MRVTTKPVAELSDDTLRHAPRDCVADGGTGSGGLVSAAGGCLEDKELKKILIHNGNEEKEHAAMVLEWIRRRDRGVR
ncbi:MAG: hypothetical protein U5J89_01890 [Fodinibius sp.]|nr:hypothetical protein [Fodinibius sp.]MDZ7658020.1 hypothetical protein [Fodinibius sp.]